jgi:hypothetical protein
MQVATIQKRLRRLVKTHGTLRAAAQSIGVDHAYFWRVMHGERKPSPPILRALGLEERIVYKGVDRRDNGA